MLILFLLHLWILGEGASSTLGACFCPPPCLSFCFLYTLCLRRSFTKSLLYKQLRRALARYKSAHHSATTTTTTAFAAAIHSPLTHPFSCPPHPSLFPPSGGTGMGAADPAEASATSVEGDSAMGEENITSLLSCRCTAEGCPPPFPPPCPSGAAAVVMVVSRCVTCPKAYNRASSILRRHSSAASVFLSVVSLASAPAPAAPSGGGGGTAAVGVLPPVAEPAAAVAAEPGGGWVGLLVGGGRGRGTRLGAHTMARHLAVMRVVACVCVCFCGGFVFMGKVEWEWAG
jgi:hypothetical protein